ncbi:hypothetical protein ACLOJK_035910 [Asimina triloba]
MRRLVARRSTRALAPGLAGNRQLRVKEGIVLAVGPGQFWGLRGVGAAGCCEDQRLYLDRGMIKKRIVDRLATVARFWPDAVVRAKVSRLNGQIVVWLHGMLIEQTRSGGPR